MLNTVELLTRLPGAGRPPVETSDAIILLNVASGLTATPSGTQSTSMPIGALISEFANIASNGDGALLPKATAGVSLMIANASAKSLNLFPQVGEKVNGVQDSAFALAAGKNCLLFATAAASWRALVTA